MLTLVVPVAAAAPAVEAPAVPALLVAEEAAVGGTALALSLDVAAGDEAGLALLGLVPLGAAAGAGVGLGLRRARWDEGQVMLFTTTQLVVTGNAMGLGYAAGLDEEAGLLGLAGLGTGSLLGASVSRWAPTGGELAIVRAGMLWGGLAGVGSRFLAQRDDRRGDVGVVVVGTDIGLAAGVLLAAQRGRPERSTVVAVQLAGLGGATAGLAVGLGLQGSGLGNRRSPIAGAAIGGVAGLGLGLRFLGRGESPVAHRGRPPTHRGSASVMPTRDGDGVMLAWTGSL